MPEDVALEYAEIIRHETLRVAVCGMLENECSLNIPEELQTIMEKTFLQFYDQYIETANKHLHLDSQPMIVSFILGGTFGVDYKRCCVLLFICLLLSLFTLLLLLLYTIIIFLFFCFQVITTFLVTLFFYRSQ